MESKERVQMSFPFGAVGNGTVYDRLATARNALCEMLFLCVWFCVFSFPPSLPKHHGVICVYLSDSDFSFSFKSLCFPGMARVWSFLVEKYSRLFGFFGTPWAVGVSLGREQMGRLSGAVGGWPGMGPDLAKVRPGRGGRGRAMAGSVG